MDKYVMFPDIYLEKLYYVIARRKWFFILNEIERWDSYTEAEKRLNYWNGK